MPTASWRMRVSSSSTLVSAVGSMLSVAVAAPAAKVMLPAPSGSAWVLFPAAHRVPGLGGDVAAQVPAGRVAVEVVALQRRRVAGGERDVVGDADLVGEGLEDARHAAPGMRFVGVGAGGAGEAGARDRRRQVVDLGGVVAHHRVDPAEGIAVADEEDAVAVPSTGAVFAMPFFLAWTPRAPRGRRPKRGLAAALRGKTVRDWLDLTN